MSLPNIPGLRLDNWVSDPENRLDALRALETHLAKQELRNPCQLDVQNLDTNTYGQHYYKDGIEHIDLNSSIVNAPHPYQAVETLFHESRHAYQNHIVQNSEMAQDQVRLHDWQMSAEGGYVNPNETLNYSDYRFQPTEVDAREVARNRTDDLYQGTFRDTTLYTDYKEQKELEIVDAIEYAKNEYQLGDNLSEKEIVAAIQAEARQAMISKYEFQKGEDLDINKAQSIPSSDLSDSMSEQTNEEIAKSAGEIASNVTGGPAGAEAGKIAGEAASEAQTKTAEVIGQSTEEPINAVENTAKESPANDISQSDEEQYYGYSH